MAATPQDVQSKLTQAMSELDQATSSPKKIVAQYGTDPNKWPAGHLKNCGLLILAAKAEAGQLQTPTLKASFTAKEV